MSATFTAVLKSLLLSVVALSSKRWTTYWSIFCLNSDVTVCPRGVEESLVPQERDRKVRGAEQKKEDGRGKKRLRLIKNVFPGLMLPLCCF